MHLCVSQLEISCGKISQSDAEEERWWQVDRSRCDAIGRNVCCNSRFKMRLTKGLA